MSDANDAPDWSLLPYAPHKFFKLVGEFDRKDLKRSYNQLLRRFKPERFPAEFQRIRAAYEQLDNQLRYGMEVSPSSGATAYEWQTDDGGERTSAGSMSEAYSRTSASDPDVAAARSRAAPSSRKLPLHERIQHEPLANVYRELSASIEKTAYEFYALAVMSDVVDRKDGLQFVRWILQGLQRHRDDHGLATLLYEYYRGPIATPAIRGLLVATSKAVPHDRFFSLTEPLWKQLLRELPFEDFQSTLKSCEENIRDIGIDCQLAFLIELLKPAIWKGDPAWIESTMDFIEQHFDRIPPHLQYEIDVLAMLRKYALQRQQLLARHPLWQQIDRALCGYFTQDQRLGDHGVLACQIQISQNPAALLEAISFGDEIDYENIYLVWISIAQDVFDRNLEPRNTDQDISPWQSRAQAVLRRIQSVTRSSSIWNTWSLAEIGYRVGLVAMYFGIVMTLCLLLMFLTLWVSSDAITAFVLLLSVGGGLGLSHWLYLRYLKPKWVRYCYQKELECYRKLWRSEFIEFLQRSQLDYFELRALLYQCDITGLSTANRAAEFYSRDYALSLFSTAQRFMV